MCMCVCMYACIYVYLLSVVSGYYYNIMPVHKFVCTYVCILMNSPEHGRDPTMKAWP